MRTKALALIVAVGLPGCAAMSAQNKAYVAASVTKQVVTESHKIWSEQLNEKAGECDASTETAEAFDECLGPFAHNDDVVLALEIYKSAAESLFVVLKSDNPEKTAIDELKKTVIDAAWDLMDKLPDDRFGAVKNQLKSIVGK
jgi:hypothetical protein